MKILLAHRDDWYRGPPRIDGFFQYPVPEFAWDHLTLSKGFKVDLFDYPSYDWVFLDDGKYKDYARFSPNPPHHTYRVPLVAAYILYPTLTRSHYRRRLERVKNNADLVLIDHDDLRKWREDSGLPCFRMAYCVDETRYVPLEKDIDVGFYCIYGWNKERPALDRWLADFCSRHGYTYHTTNGESVGEEYSRLLGRTKVIVHMNRTMETRAPRLFDAAAAGCAILTSPIPYVDGELWPDHEIFLWPYSMSYRQFAPDDIPVYTDLDCAQVADGLNLLLDGGLWEHRAQSLRQYVLSHHTWRIRAKQLHSVLTNRREYP